MVAWKELDVIEIKSTKIAERISQAAQNELLKSGVLGFRIDRVARTANCSISVIYRYYVDRTGLIIHVLAQAFDQIQRTYIDELHRYFSSLKTITVDDVIKSIPSLDESARSSNMKLRLLSLALSTENDDLRQMIGKSIIDVLPKWQELLELIRNRAPLSGPIDTRVYSMILVMHMPYYNLLLGDSRVEDHEFKEYLLELMTLPAMKS